MAKIPLDLVRHGHSPWTLLQGYAQGVRAALARDFPNAYLPTRRAEADALPVVESKQDDGSPALIRR